MHLRIQSDRRRYHAFALLLAVAGVAASCGGERPSISESKASDLLSILRARPASPVGVARAERFVSDHGKLQPTFVASADKPTALVSLPARASEAVHVEDATTGAGIDVKLLDALGSLGRTVGGAVVYAGAHVSGATLIHQPVPEGNEDYLVFDQKPPTTSVEYDVVMGHGVAGLRLIENQLEMLDTGGAPRLRVAPPYLVDANGETVAATLAVEGCAVDTDPGAPWDRAVTPLGSATCRVRVSWSESAVSYPAVLDPRWVSTGNMTSVRQDFTATLLSTGKVLAVGGRTSGTSTTGLATAELFDRTTNTWAATASLTGGRYLHAAVQLGTTSSSTTSGKVLVAGGTSAGASLNTAQLYSASSGTWVAATNLNVARHSQTATLLTNGNVLLAAGLSGTTVLNTAAVYNPQSGAGSWTATGNMPQAVKFHTATLLQVSGNSTLNNKVLVAGGNSGSASVANVQLFDGTSSWSSLTALSSAREGHTATALSNGNVLVTGGRSGSATLNTTLLFNAASGSGSWASAGTMTSARQLHTATLLPSAIVKNGQVLVAGGSNGTSTLSSTELWNGTSTWTATTAMGTPVQGQTAILLSNNMVLIAGGANGTTTVATAALYDGSFALSCTSNSQCATGFCVSGVCCDTACNGGCGACNLTGKVGTCSAVTSGTVCRAATGACDAAETCSGSSLSCPADVLVAAGTVCRASTGACDTAETCTGTSAACPANALAPAGTVCRPSAGGCDQAETCSGTSASCPADVLAAAGTVCRAALGVCDVAESCTGTSASCPTDRFGPAGTVCAAASGAQGAELCTGSSGVCPESGKAGDVLGFESAGDWVASSSAGSVVGLNGTHTQGVESLEVTAQNYATFTSAPITAIGNAGTLLLLDVMLPIENPPNPFWLGTVDMFLSAPSVEINNDYAGHADLTGLPHGQWETLGFQLSAQDAAKLSGGGYSDLTFTIALNVPNTETGHFLFDNLRTAADVIPSLYGIATDSAGHTKAIFTYTTTATSVALPYGEGNALLDVNGAFIAAPQEVPPQTFVAETHAPFVATLAGTQLTWRVGSHSATATLQSTQLPVTTLGDGTKQATLPDGRKVNLDSTPPQDPTLQPEPAVGAPYNGALTGQFTVGPTGAATYAVPIAIPPGVAGMAPNLSLVYNSQSGDGIAGQGIDLAGLSMVHRCPKTRFQDGAARPVTMDDMSDPTNTDGICLDGQRLFEDPVGSGSYRPERQDFSKVLRTGGYFQITTKAGETRYYGLTPTERVSASGVGNGAASTGIAMWLLDRVVDSWGNYFDVHYNEGNANFAITGVRVSEIDYTGHLTASGTVDVPTFSQVTFGYEARPDTRWVRFGSSKFPKNQRLTSITTPRGAYTFNYGNEAVHDPMEPSLLHEIGYCTGATCLTSLDFTWQPNTYAWESAPGYTLPAAVSSGSGLKGTQFVDLNGDGRLDLVLARTNGSTKGVWLNSGQTWEPLTGAGGAFPAFLSDGNDNPTGVRFGDFDGDGVVDLVQDQADVTVNGQTTHYAPAVWLNKIPTGGGWEFHPEYGNVPPPSPFTTPGYLNFRSPSKTSSGSAEPAVLADIDGDGKADIVQAMDNSSQAGAFADVQILLNRFPDTGWVAQRATPAAIALYDAGDAVNEGLPPPFQVRDVNRDGLPDLVSERYSSFPDGSVAAGEVVLINRGFPQDRTGCDDGPPGVFASPGTLCFAQPIARGSAAGGTGITLVHPPSFGDIDGDGFYDVVDYYSLFQVNGNNDPSAFLAAVGFGDGTGLGFTSQDTQPYLSKLAGSSPTIGFDPTLDGVPEDFGYALADINADGLVDLVRNHFNRFTGPFANRGGGQVLFNNGTTWTTGADAHDQWQIPVVPGPAIPGVVPSDVTADSGSAFIDLDGDGVRDLIQEEGPRGAWINTFRPPVITAFPNGLAASTQVVYRSITEGGGTASSNGFYFEDESVDPGTRRVILPVRVVTSVIAEDGTATGATDTTGYSYHSLRVDPNGRGPLGFRQVLVEDSASNTVTTTTYAQAYPYTGLVTKVERAQDVPNHQFLLTTTSTQYCDSIAQDSSGNVICSSPGIPYQPRTSLFVYPSDVGDVRYLHPEQGDIGTYISTGSHFRYDAVGNAIHTTVGTTKFDGATEYFTRDLVNAFGVSGSQEQQQGKVTQTVATSSSGTQESTNSPLVLKPNITHTTSLEYIAVIAFGGSSASALALAKKKVEPGAGWPVELDTAYAYDRFGNVAITTSCANDFGNCAVGAMGPVGSSDPLHHPPFRTTRVSYDPSDFNAPTGPALVSRLSYGIGRFPVRTTNALGQTEYSAYDPVKAVLLQKTGPNGINTCSIYDDIGRQVSEIARCGSDDPLVTTTQHLLAPSSVPQGLSATPKLLTIVRPPNGAVTWTYMDDQGKTIATLGRSFNGGFIETLTQYDALARTKQASKAFLTTDQPSWTVTSYDVFNRVQQVVDDLGAIDGSGLGKHTTTQISYNGASVETDRTVNSQIESRRETKNALGKVAVVTDATNAGISYAYDSDGNLVCVDQNGDNVDDCGTHPSGKSIRVSYDLRGLKQSSTDPDLGTWAYIFDGFGDLVSQTDANGQTTTMTYDAMSRMTSKTDMATGNTAQWLYDVAPGAGIGKLAAMVSEPDPKLNGTCAIPVGFGVTGGNRAVKSFTYTAFGDIQSVSECTDGAPFLTSYEYDPIGRQSLIRYPAVRNSQLAVGYHYTGLGFLQYLTDESLDYSVLWQAKKMNAFGQVTDEQARNGVETIANRDSATGWLLDSTSTAHADGNTVIQNWSYTYDEAGDLLTRGRADAVNDSPSSETFTYDLLNRVLTSEVSVPNSGYDATESYDYDSLGNLMHKAGKAYTYGVGCSAGTRVAGPHAVCTVDAGTPFVYDGNGNLTTSPGRTVSYNPRNKVSDIQNATATVEFMYGAEGNRVVQATTSGGIATRTVYVGLGGTGKSLYERTTSGGNIEHVHFIYAGTAHGGNAFAVRVLADDGSVADNKYFSFDHLGSTTAVSDAVGHVQSVAAAGADAGVLGYDPWGARRNPDGQAASPASFDSPVGHREFTGQETIPDVGLINMNGRVYDPVLGRFLSPDPNVQFAGDLQSYNRYSYVANNPLRYTDPSGYFWGGFLHSLANFFENPMNDFELGSELFACYEGGPAVCIIWGLLITTFNAGVSLANGAPWDQTLESTAIGVGVGILTYGLADYFGAGPWAGIISGAASAAVATALTDLATDQQLGWNVLDAAVIAAASGAAIYGLQQVAPVSKASAATAHGGGGSGADELEAYLRSEGYGARSSDSLGAELLSADAPGVLQALDPEGSMANFISSGESPLLESEDGSDWHRLTHTFKEVVRPMQSLGLDLDAIRVNPTTDALGQAGFTLGDHIWLNSRESNADQAWYLPHEMTHSAQVNSMTLFLFAIRYGIEWAVTWGDPYGDPLPYTGSVTGFNPVGRDYYLDQAADHVRDQFFPSGRP